MEQVKTSLALVIAVLLQWSLRGQIPFIEYVDFPLLVVILVALNRESLKAMLFGSVAGIAVDALSGGLLGASGFSMTLTAFCVAELARRVLLLDNPLLRIPVIAGASLLQGILYYSMHRLLGQELVSPLLETLAYTMLGTTAVGTITMLIVENFFSTRARLRRGSGPSRRPARRSGVRLGKRRSVRHS